MRLLAGNHKNWAAGGLVTPALNLSLRGATLTSKFALIFFLAIFLEPSDLGLYGLLTVTISYSIYVIGFDFYTYSTRELLGQPRDLWSSMLRDQGVYFMLAYLLVLPLLVVIFLQGWLPWRLAGWFFALLVVEHLAQELNRLLVAMSEQLLASVVLFLRSGLWGLALLPLMWVVPESRQLGTVLTAWLAASSLAVLLGVVRLLQLDHASLSRPIDWLWLGRGLKVALPLLVGTLALRGVFTFDRYWVEHVAGLEVLGAYTLYMGTASAIVAFLDAGVFVFFYPRLIEAWQQREKGKFKRELRRLALQTVVLTALLAAAAAVLLPMLLNVIDRAFYLEYLSLFYWLLGAIMLYVLGMVPHYGLYASGRDQPIVSSHVAGLLVFLVAAYLLVDVVGSLAVPWALCITFAVVLVWKLVSFTTLWRGKDAVGESD